MRGQGAVGWLLLLAVLVGLAPGAPQLPHLVDELLVLEHHQSADAVGVHVELPLVADAEGDQRFHDPSSRTAMRKPGGAASVLAAAQSRS
eukprot:3010748-Pyramimonas_sp.AAC.1